MNAGLERVLVTGAGGFIGTTVVRALVTRGYAVRAVGRHTRPVSVKEAEQIRWHVADLLDAAAVDSLIETTRPARLIHLAWETRHPEFWTAPSNLDWTSATLHLARRFAEHGGRRFIGLGSCAEYSWIESETSAFDEMRSARLPATLYGEAKNSAFNVLSKFFSNEGIEFAWACLFHPYGPGEDRATLVPATIKSLLSGQPAWCTAGSQQLDFIYVADVAEAIAALAGSGATGRFNVGTGQGTSVAEVVTMIGDVLGRRDLLRQGALPSRAGDPARLVARIERMQNEAGWWPRTSLEHGIRETIAWWRGRSDTE